MFKVEDSKQIGSTDVNTPEGLPESRLKEEIIELIYWLRFNGITYEKVGIPLRKQRGQIKLLQQRKWWPPTREEQLFTLTILKGLKKEVENGKKEPDEEELYEKSTNFK